MNNKEQRLYQGIRKEQKATVYVDGVTLSPESSIKIRFHAPEFEWGYAGSGPSQLALAILYDALGSEKLALDHYPDFKHEFIASADYHDGFAILESQIAQWIEQQLNNNDTN